MPIFTDVLGEFVAQTHDPRLSAIDGRLRAPRSVAVRGRPGVGRAAVVRALSASGVRVVAEGARADAHVVVVAEVLKPEDQRMLRADVPTVVVLNKADLSGPGSPIASAARVAADIAATVGRPTVPTIAPLACVELDDQVVAALGTLAGTPADMTSVDAFVGAQHPVPAEVRQRMLVRLDRFGLAHAVLAVAGGAAPAEVVRTLRDLSGIDRVVAALDGCGPEVTYRRVCAARDELCRVAVASRDDGLASFLATDEVVVAVMAAAVDAAEVSGWRVDPGDDAATHLNRAVQWRRYADGPLGALHRRCASDISRGSLRLLGRAR